MPELPEVETVRRGLERTIVGKTIASVEVRAPKIFADSAERIEHVLVGTTVKAAERRAKVLLVRLDNEWTLAIHLKMTGQLVVVSGAQTKRALGTGFIAGHPEKAYEQPLPHKHTHVIVHFADPPRVDESPRVEAGGTTLYFNDLRKFGWFRLYPGVSVEGLLAIEDVFKNARLGPEPFSDEFSVSYFADAIGSRKIPIKTALLDQTVVAGVGNIYADEALFRAGIRPTRSASSLTQSEIKKLQAAIKRVLVLGIEYGGTTMNTFRNVEGTSGKMRDYLKVYGREGLPCTVCGNPIERIKIGQRSSHFCPNCQR